MRSSSDSRTLGLSVVEVLVALIVIGIAFAALAALQVSNLRVTRDSKLASIATQAGNDAMEQVVKEFLEQVDLDAEPVFACGAPYMLCTGDRTISLDGVDYVAGYDISVDAGVGIATITVSVDEPKAVTFSQLVSCMDVVPPPSFAEPAPCPDPSESTSP